MPRGCSRLRPADYFFVVVGAFWLVVVAPPWAVVLAPLCRLVVVGLFLLPPLSLLPHDAAKNSNGTSATTNRPYTIRGIPTWSCRMLRLSLPVRFFLDAWGSVRTGTCVVADPALVPGEAERGIGGPLATADAGEEIRS